jgi:hypothetical protein
MEDRVVFGKGGLGNMFRRESGIWAILLWLFFLPLFSFAGEIYRWIDEKGVVHFTDDLSQIPAQYQNQFEKRKVGEEVSGTDEKPMVPRHGQGVATESSNPSVKPQAKPDRTKEDLEEYERKIEAKKAIEKRISTLEEEMRVAEERVKQLKEKEEYSHPVTRYRNRVRDRVPLEEPPSEKDRLLVRIMNIKKQIAALEEQVSEIKRGL